MKILVYGAGVIGSLYAAKLKYSGQDVTLLARGRRLDEVCRYGIILEKGATNHRTVTPVKTVEQLKPDDKYDLVMVIMPKNHIPEVLPVLAENTRIPNALFMCNNAAGPNELIEALGRERVLLGFPGAGGIRKDHVIRYRIVSKRQQPTALGELVGASTERVREIAEVLNSAGFPTSLCSNMDAWLKTHVAEISPMTNAVLSKDGDHKKVANDPATLIKMIHAIREGYAVLKALNIPIEPAKHKIFNWMPIPILTKIMRKVLLSETTADIIGHAAAAQEEMCMLADEFRALAKSTSVKTSAMDDLRRSVKA